LYLIISLLSPPGDKDGFDLYNGFALKELRGDFNTGGALDKTGTVPALSG
jgi:hypothetical protein